MPSASPTPMRFAVLRSGLFLLCGAALGPAVRAADAYAELGRPLFREFAPGAAKVGFRNQAVTQDRAGYIYIFSHTIMRYYDGVEWLPLPLPEAALGVRKFAQAPDGTVYLVGPNLIGYLAGAGPTAHVVSLADRLPPSRLGAREMNDVLVTKEAAYFADEEKILCWRQGRFSVIPCRTPPPSLRTHLHAIDDAVYVTAPGRPLSRIVDDRLEPVVDDPVLRDHEIIRIDSGPAGTLHLLTADAGFYQVADGRVTVWPREANRWLAGRQVIHAVRLSDGGLAVIFSAPTGSGGARFDADGRYVGPIDYTLGLYTSLYRGLFCDREGGLWLGTNEGPFRIEWPSPISMFDAVNGLGFGGVSAVARRHGVIQAVSDGKVFQLSPPDASGLGAHFVPVSGLTTADLPTSGALDPAAGPVSTGAAAPAPFGSRWVAKTDGVVLVSAEGNPLRRLPAVVTHNLGVVTCLMEEGEGDQRVLWIGSSLGLMRVEVARVRPLAVPFQVVLHATGVRAGEELEPHHAPLRFDFLAIRMQVADGVTYQSRLVGFERRWTDWSAERERSFTRLPAGSYRFEVRARDGDGLMAGPAAIGFTVQPPWWFTWWAILGYIAAGAGALAAWVRHHTAVLRRRAAALEIVVAERTAELVRQNAELVRLNRLELDEKITARLAEEKARLETLRYQLNPHFLFNTLASISAALGIERSTARTMLERLADFCRLTLHRGNDEEWTTLGDEMKLLRAYLDIEQTRWGELLEVRIDCPAELAPESVPHFLLLPLVENALKYGHATSEDRVGLRLTARREGDGALVLEVANTGRWVEPQERRSGVSLGVGLDNLRERLRRHFPREHAFEIEPVDGWVIVRLRILPRAVHPASDHAADAAH